MTVTTVDGSGDPRVKSGPYIGNGVTTSLDYDFPVQVETNLLVTRQNADLTETVLTLTTDYTVTSVGDDAGGTVELVDPATSFPTGTKIVITYDGDYAQTVDFSNQGAILLAQLEASLDKLTMHLRTLKEHDDRSVTTDAFGTVDVSTLRTNVNALALISTEMAALAAIISDLTTLAALNTEITTLAALDTAITTLNGISADITAVAALAANVTTVAGISANVTTVAGLNSEVTTLAGLNTEITALDAIGADITTVATNNANVTTVAGLNSEVNTLVGLNAEIVALDAINADITTVATNILDVTNFADVYVGPSASAPTTRADTSALVAGDIYFNTSTNSLYVYNSGAWSLAVIATTALEALIAARYGTDNAVGTVSETSGVPTGAIFEQGSNANGEYIKYADGTMLMWGAHTCGTTDPTDWTTPATLATTVGAVVSITSRTVSTGRMANGQLTDVNTVSHTCFSSTNTRVASSNQIVVFGRWF